jgi:hypothetical protein
MPLSRRLSRWFARRLLALRSFFHPRLSGQVVTRMGTRPSP